MADEPTKEQIEAYHAGLKLLGLPVHVPDDVDLTSQMLSPEFAQFIIETLRSES